MRNTFAARLHEMMGFDRKLFLLYGDIGNRLFDRIKEDFPDRIENAGVAEASMVGIAAGISQAGYTPVCYTINSFLYLKGLEQIKLDLAYPSRKAILVGTGGGLGYGSLGTSHHSIEDYAVLGSIPNLRLYSPADARELSLSLDDALHNSSPSYLRIGKKGEENLSNDSNLPELQSEPLRLLSKASEARSAVVSVGPIGSAVQSAIGHLEGDEAVDFYSLYRIRPWDSEDIRRRFSHYGEILVVEEHYALGGVASLFLDAFSSADHPTRVFSAAISNKFFTGLGGQSGIREANGLDESTLGRRIQQLGRK
jgi:transketolase